MEKEHVRQSDGPRMCKEFVVLEYRDGDVYVPLAHLDLIKVVDSENIPHRLDSLSGSTAFGVTESGRNTRLRKSMHAARVKTRAKIRKQLVNLNTLYANRLTQKRAVFPIDPEAEQRFNNSCGFKLTRDQQRATDEMLADLSKCTRPMDRLLCGDVGFGKTEVAMRAAFRVLAAGKQVALLAPTTILAQQHYQTFRGRFEESFPNIKIACLTRFARRATVLEEREMLSSGEMSIAVGTHMLLGDSVQFKDLGLLIVDEENRWGCEPKGKASNEVSRCRYLNHVGNTDSSHLASCPQWAEGYVGTENSSAWAEVRNHASGTERRGCCAQRYSNRN